MSIITNTFWEVAPAGAARVRTLGELLRERARRTPDRVAYTFLGNDGEEQAELTYGELDQKARSIAAYLQSLDARGERVLLLYPPGAEYVAAFFGCLYAGAVAVPAYPPRLNHSLRRLQSVTADARPAVALTVGPILERAESLFGQAPELLSLRWLATDRILGDLSGLWREHSAEDPSAPAFLQYTSGSTSKPRGVMVSHRNLLHNEALIRDAFGQTEESVIVGWLPLYHDMGLIGNVLQPLFTGARCVLMSPLAFLQSPSRWLSAISRYRATTSGGPNFAYDLCARKVTAEQRAALDLSSWEVAFNGAEPVRAATLERFAEVFAECGFRREAFQPCYGLAEATLLVSAGRVSDAALGRAFDAEALRDNLVSETDAGAAEATVLVGCGTPPTDVEVAVVDHETGTRCAPGRVGEIWVAGESVAAGYWNRDEETAHTFGAHLADTGERPFLRTGDLGFLHRGELFITGRIKDLIIIRGLNHYPQDIELTVETSTAGLRPGCGAAFSVEVGGEERLVVVQEADVRRLKDADAALADVRQAVAQQHEVQPYAVVLLRPGSVPKTSSGKVQRHECREKFLTGAWSVVAGWSAGGPQAGSPSAAAPLGESEGGEEIAAWLVARLAAKAGVRAEEIDTRHAPVRYGLDSLAAVELTHAVETELGVPLLATSFLGDQSIDELAAGLAARRRARAEAPRADGREPQGEPASEATEAQPLSYGQKTIWFLHQLDPSSPAYNVAVPFAVGEALDAATLRRALLTLTARHPSLRTTFSDEAGEPVQRVHRRLEPSFTEKDVTGWTDEAVNAYLTEESQRPFDLEQGPLLRASLLRRDEGRHVLLLVLHHIVVDFWSLAILMNELGELYRSDGVSAPELSPPPAGYADFVRAQRELLEGPRGERSRAYWEGQLAGGLPALELPGDFPRPAAQTYRGASELTTFGPELTERLQALSREHGATLYMTLLAAFQVLLHRYTGQKDFFVGSPASGRSRAEWAPLVGYFVNPVPLRADFGEDVTFAEHLARVRRTVLAALEHQDYPFAAVAEGLQLKRDLSRPQLFQVMFVLQKAHLTGQEGLAGLALPGAGGDSLALGDVRLEPLALPDQVAQFDLTLSLAQVGGGLAAALQYNTDLFSRDRIARLLEHYRTLLEELTARPDLRVSRLGLLSAAERERQIVEWNQTTADCPTGASVQQLFEAQAEKNPGGLAVAAEQERVTYDELNRRANQLAHRLRALGVGPEVAVAVCLERSPEMVVALLAVLKAGGFYVPLDAAYPKERLALMLADSGVRVLITRQRRAEALGGGGALVVDLDADAEALSREPDANPGVRVRPENLAYMIYTSGSTGSPKGVAIRHAGLLNLVTWHQQAYGVTSGDRATLIASPAFDASVWELWPYLTQGASLHVPHEDVRGSAPELWKWLASEGVTVCFVPTPLAEAMLGEQWPDAQIPLRVMLTGGDKLQHAPRRPLPFALVNHYGPTESTVVATRAAVAPDAEAAAAPPIGRPIANTQAYVLDAHMQVVPVGVAGELYVGGVGLARGYHGRPDLTAGRFVPDPFGTTPGGRLYKTGDLTRYQPDGRIEFLGRLDHQVKISGFRIEPGEIEAMLNRHPGVREVVAVALGDDAARKRLVAYVVPAEQATLAAAELREYLKERLPYYMVPANFVVLPELPLTTNGKVDRAALPEPAEVAPQAEVATAAPRTPVEELLAGIWSKVLKVAEVGPHDNFFELGGHSLLATQLVSRVREAFQVELPLRALFESPTVAGLADHVEASLRAGHERPQTPPLVPVLRDNVLPLSSAQERLWFLDRLEPDSPLYNIPAAVRLRGPLHAAALGQSLSEIVRRHEVLRTTFAARGGKPVQLIAPALELHLPLTDLGGLAGEEREQEIARLVREEARAPFDLAAGPLLRTRLLRAAEDEHVLLLTIHHIISDGWSIGILVRELKALYEAYADGRGSPYPELTVQYADFAHWQKQLLEGEWLAEELAYWGGRLRTPPAVLELPTDRPRPAVQTARGAVETLRLPADTREALKALSHGAGVTLFMTLLAAFKALLHRYTGQVDITVGTPVAGRNSVETEQLIGFFANTLVLRTDLSGDPSFRELLGRVRETALGAYLHQNVPFERLVEEFHTARDLSRTPLFQIMIASQNAHAETLELAGLTLTPLEAATDTAKFDLLLFCEESAEGVEFALEYNTDLFDRATVRRLLGHLRNVLASAARDPEAPVSALTLMDGAERAEILEVWNDTGRRYEGPRLIHAMFERQAGKTPDAVALRSARGAVTYRELNERADRLARHLRGLGVGPEVLVAVYMGRSPEMVAALLAIFKAGGAYVPLDPAYPPQRMSFIVEDARAPVLLTEECLRGRIPPNRARVVVVDGDWEAAAPGVAGPPPAEPLPDNLAYVIYTSGSTGRPKGVAITHRSAVTLLNWSHEIFSTGQLRAVLASTSICFDLSVFELFAPLGCGGEVVLAEDALQLPSLAAEVSLVNTVPSAAGELLRLRALPACVRTLNLAGEALPQRLVDEIFAQAEGVEEIWNLYGPSEDTTYSTAALLRRGAGERVTIGRPIACTRAYLLDARLNPVVVGVAGELYLAGEGLARGYHGRPDLTAERFVPDPFSERAGARLYKTGDLARWLPDGRIEFLGRLDHQVKIRGFRIEPGEIESALVLHPQIEKVVVTARDDAAGGKRLVAYFVAPEGAAPTPEELRACLRERLPDYMTPSAFVRLDAMPLTLNGKVDRAALPAPDEARREVTGQFVAPRNATEEELGRIWGEVLGLREIGVHDNFFDLGGHSLLAAQAMAKLAEKFRLELPLRTLFESPTVAELAAAVEAAQRSGGPEALPIRPAPREAFRARANSRRGPAATGAGKNDGGS